MVYGGCFCVATVFSLFRVNQADVREIGSGGEDSFTN